MASFFVFMDLISKLVWSLLDIVSGFMQRKFVLLF
jgi:hypothetical protein